MTILTIFAIVLGGISGVVMCINGYHGFLKDLSIKFQSIKEDSIKYSITLFIILIILVLLVAIFGFIVSISTPTNLMYDGGGSFMYRHSYIPEPYTLGELNKWHHESFKVFKQILFLFFRYVGLTTILIICSLFFILTVTKFTNLVIDYLVNTRYMAFAIIFFILSGILHIIQICITNGLLNKLLS